MKIEESGRYAFANNPTEEVFVVSMAGRGLGHPVIVQDAFGNVSRHSMTGEIFERDDRFNLVPLQREPRVVYIAYNSGGYILCARKTEQQAREEVESITHYDPCPVEIVEFVEKMDE